MGKYHPHGDQSIYDTLVRMAQDFAIRATRWSTARATSARSTTTGRPRCDTPRRAWRASRSRCCATSTTTPSTSCPTTTTRSTSRWCCPARFPNLLVNGSSGIAVGMATNIPPHNLGEMIDATVALHRRSRHRPRRPDAAHQGPRLPDRRRDHRPRRDPPRLRDRPRPRADAGDLPRRADRPGQGGDHRHRAPLHGQEGRRRRPDHQDRRPRARQEDPRDLRPARRDRPHRHAPRDRAEARRDPRGRPEQALQAHADAADLRRQHGGAGRRRAAAAQPARS